MTALQILAVNPYREDVRNNGWPGTSSSSRTAYRLTFTAEADHFAVRIKQHISSKPRMAACVVRFMKIPKGLLHLTHIDIRNRSHRNEPIPDRPIETTVKTGKVHDEQNFSAPPPTADIIGVGWDVSSVPIAAVAQHDVGETLIRRRYPATIPMLSVTFVSEDVAKSWGWIWPPGLRQGAARCRSQSARESPAPVDGAGHQWDRSRLH